LLGVLGKVARPVEKELKTKNDPCRVLGMTNFYQKAGIHY